MNSRNSLAMHPLQKSAIQPPRTREKQKGGWKTQGRGKHIIKPLPKKRFWTPPPVIRFPTPVCSRPVIFLRGNGTDQDESDFLKPPKLVLEGALLLYVPPPPKIARYVLPPPLCDFPKEWSQLRSSWWKFRIFFVFFSFWGAEQWRRSPSYRGRGLVSVK